MRLQASHRVAVGYRRAEHAAAPPPQDDGLARSGRGPSRLHPARALLRPDVRGGHRAGREQPAPRARRGARPERPGRLPAGLLRDLVGVDELHLVRVRVRHRRRPLPAGRPRADRRRPGLRRRRATGDGAPGLHDRRPRLRDHADRPDQPVAARRPLRSRASRRAACATPAASSSASSAGSGCSPCPDALFLPGFLVLAAAELARPGVGGARGRDVVAPAAHRRALRALHDHRARRVRARGDHRRAERARRRRHAGGARRDRRRRPADGVRDVVDLLRHAVRARRRPRPLRR